MVRWISLGKGDGHEDAKPPGVAVEHGDGIGHGAAERLPDLGSDGRADPSLRPLSASSAAIYSAVARVPVDQGTGEPRRSGRQAERRAVLALITFVSHVPTRKLSGARCGSSTSLGLSDCDGRCFPYNEGVAPSLSTEGSISTNLKQAAPGLISAPPFLRRISLQAAPPVAILRFYPGRRRPKRTS
jgi:hypothetical protein